jgi:hypothetical protein
MLRRLLQSLKSKSEIPSSNATQKKPVFIAESTFGADDLVMSYENSDQGDPLQLIVVRDQISVGHDKIYHEKSIFIKCEGNELNRLDNTYRGKTYVTAKTDKGNHHVEVPHVSHDDAPNMKIKQCKRISRFFKENGIQNEAALKVMCATPSDGIEEALKNYAEVIRPKVT